MAGQKLTLEVQSGWTVNRLKKYLEDEHGVRCIKQRISVEGVHMVGARTLADYGIGLEADLKLVERPPAAISDEQGGVDEALTHLHSMSDGLRRRWEEVSAAAQALEDEKAALLQANSGGAKLKKKLKLNVGGTEYKGVKRETLCAVPESHLAELFSGRWEQCLLRDSSGSIFLDIDPACFDKVLALLVELKQRPGEPAGAPPPLTLAGLRTHLPPGAGLPAAVLLTPAWCCQPFREFRRSWSRPCTVFSSSSDSATCLQNPMQRRESHRRRRPRQSQSPTAMKLH